MNKDITTNKITKILYEQLNNYLNTKDKIPNIINISIDNEYSNEVFQVVEEMPEFPGGMVECMKFLGRNIQYPKISQENGIQGRVIVTFVINKDGSITEAKIARSVDYYLDKEALRVVSLMPKWKPGKINGKAVRVKYTLPVMFRLQ